MLTTRPPVSLAAPTAIWTLTGKMHPDASPQTVEISRMPFRVGRRTDLDLSLGSPVVSGQHAEFTETAGLLSVRDLGSTNGTFINGKLLESAALVSVGDWVEIGDVQLRIGVKDPVGPTANDTATSYGQKTAHFMHASSATARSLNELIRGRRLSPCFQPIHMLSDRDIHGYEFLARSQVEGMTSPAQMFPAAEKAGCEIELSMLCREQAVEFSVCLPAKLPLFLNTHPNEPLMEAVLPQLQQLREKWPQRAMVLEIHEGAVMNPGLVRMLRSGLHDIGVQLAYDDFGAGQARFRELVCAPSDYIKFDAALVHDLLEVGREQVQLFRSIVQSLRSEGAITVAEGIETQQMITLCEEIGFDMVQGYALSRPAIMYPQVDPFDTVVKL
ncbi:MAG: EAL domain-containing protein [Planctomycetaceae bacterium]